MTALSATIANGYMKGEFLKHETKGNTQILVTQNQIKAGLTHRRAVFFVDKEFFVLVDEGYGDGNKDKINLISIFVQAKLMKQHMMTYPLLISMAHIPHLQIITSLSALLPRQTRILTNQMLHLMFPIS